MENKNRNKNSIPTYITLGLAEEAKKDKETNTTSPSEENVIETREWSKENQL